MQHELDDEEDQVKKEEVQKKKDQVEKEIKDKQEQLREIKKKNHTVMNTLQELSVDGLPELAVTIKEIGVQEFIKNKKLGLDAISLSDFQDTTGLSNQSGRHELISAKRNGKQVVLKKFVLKQMGERAAFDRELWILRRLKHPHIVPIISAFIEKQEYGYIELPFYTNGDLLDWMRSQKNPPSVALLKKLFFGVVRGIEYLHLAKVIHGDIKPNNMLIDQEFNASLCDFHISNDSDERRTTLGVAHALYCKRSLFYFFFFLKRRKIVYFRISD